MSFGAQTLPRLLYNPFSSPSRSKALAVAFDRGPDTAAVYPGAAVSGANAMRPRLRRIASFLSVCNQ